MVTNAITSFLGKLVEQIMKPVREFLADTLLATPDVTRHADIRRLWNATLGITAGIYVLFVTAGGITVMGYETVQTRYALRQIVPRLFLGMGAAATSLTVMGKAIGLSNALAHAIMATDLADAGQGMVERVLPFALFGGTGLKLYALLLALVVIALVLAVLIGFLVRVAVMALLAVAAPLMLACHGHPLTDPVARLWWRGLAGCLVIQVAQSMTFVLALKLFFAPGATALGIPKSDQLGTMLAGVALFWVLFKIPGWALQVVLRGTPAHSPHAPTGVRILRHLAMYRLMDHYLPGMHLLRRRSSGGGGGSGGRGTGGLGPGRGGPGSGAGGRPGPPGGRSPAVPGEGPGPRADARGGTRTSARGRAAAGGLRGRASTASRTALGALAGAGARRTEVAGTAARPARHDGAREPGPASTASHVSPNRPPIPSSRTASAPWQSSRTVIRPARLRREPERAVSEAGRPVRRSYTARPDQPGTPSRSAPAPARSPLPPTTPSRRAPQDRPSPAPRARQLTLPIPVRRVRTRPPRPMQLRLPLEPPRR